MRASPTRYMIFRFHNKLYCLDASTIDLCLSMFSWANFRRTKGAIKLHVGLNHEGNLPEFVTITDGKTTELNVPKLGKSTFETAIIERYRRRESSVEEALIEMYLVGVSVRRVESIAEALLL